MTVALTTGQHYHAGCDVYFLVILRVYTMFMYEFVNSWFGVVCGHIYWPVQCPIARVKITR